MSMPSPSIAVVMSTYNGEAFVEEQIESILAQDYPNVRIFVRDDGSKDGTLDILGTYERDGKITLYAAPNLGVVGSFIELVSHVADEYDYVALCDQDDVWHADKLSRAVSLLSEYDQDVPLLYCAEYIYCDQDMRPGERSHLNRIGVGFATMLYENMVSGNTCVLNKRLAHLIAKAGPVDVYCHDWWIALVATALGRLVFDDFACLDYRRTGSNVSPSGSGGLSLLSYRIKTFFKGGQLHLITVQLNKLEKLYAPEMTADRRELLERMLNGGRIKKALTPVRLRQKLRDEVALRLLFLSGLL